MQQETFGAGIEAALAHTVAGVAPEVVNDVLIDAAIALAANGNLDGFRMDNFAAMSGMQPQKAAEFMETALDLFSTQADRALAAEGIDDTASFMAWAMQERPEKIRNAMLYQVSARDLTAYKQLARDYVRSIHPTEEGLKQAGFETMKSGSGEVLVKWQGVWTSATALAKQGRI